MQHNIFYYLFESARLEAELKAEKNVSHLH
jgi:hypothetical protein